MARYEQPLDPVPFFRLDAWEYVPHDINVDDAWTGEHTWHPGGRTLIWDNDTQVVWFRQEWTVPAEWNGRVLTIRTNVRATHTLYVEGLPFNGGPLTVNATAGQSFRFAMRADRSTRPGMIMDATMTAFPPGYQRWIAARDKSRTLVTARGTLLDEWHARMAQEGESFADPTINHANWPIIPLGEEWREPDSTRWYRMTITVPEEINGHVTANQPLILTGSFNGWGYIFADGGEKAGFPRNFGHAVITENAEPGSDHVLAIRVPTSNSGWMNDTWLRPASLHQALESQADLLVETDVWDRFLRVRPDERFIDSVLSAMKPLEVVEANDPGAGSAIGDVLLELAKLRTELAVDAPLLAHPYLQMPCTDSMVVRAESLLERPSTLGLTHPDGTIEISEAETSRFHRHALTGLTPDTEYSYRLQTGNVQTPLRTFRTAPTEFKPFTIFTWGDSHYGPEILEGIAKHIPLVKPDLICLAGDIVGDGFFDAEFVDQFLHPLRYGECNVPVQFAVGNHDHGSWMQRNQVTNPYLDARFDPVGSTEGEIPYCYSIDYAGCHLVFVDPYHGRVEGRNDGITKGRPQYEWMDRDLTAAADAKWKLVYIHEPPFCETWEGGYYDGEEEVRRDMVPLMERHGVDLCISGHAHTYERGMPHPPYDPETGEGNTVSYVISGGGGSLLDNRKYYEWPQIDIPPHRILSDDKNDRSNDQGEYYRYHFCVMRVEEHALRHTAYWIRTDGTIVDVLDQFTIRKGIPTRG
jgi:hypothetical protein